MSLFGTNQISKDFIKPQKTIYEIRSGSIFRRFAAFLIDSFIVLIVALGIAYLMSSSDKSIELQDRLDQYKIQYGVSILNDDGTYSTCEYPAMNDGESEEEYYQRIKDDSCVKSFKAFYEDKDASEAMDKSLRYSMLMISIGVLVGTSIAYLGFPLLFKNGQTLGMKIVQLGLVTTKSIKVEFMHIFIRWAIGIFVIETMIPIILISNVLLFQTYIMPCIIFLIMILATNIICFFSTPYKLFLHDLISGTVIIDMNEQVIAKSLEEYEKNVERENSL